MSKTLILLILVGFCIGLPAQPTVNLCLVKGDGYWQCLLLPDSGFTGVVSNIQFSLVFPAGSDGIDSIDQRGYVEQYLPLEIAGPPEDQGVFMYEKITGFGLITLDSLNTFWRNGDTIALCNIHLVDTADQMFLTSDSWTDANNASFYLELNGEDRTGEIISGCNPAFFTGVPEGVEQDIWRVYPNPIDSYIQIETVEGSWVYITLIDGTGRQFLAKKAFIGPGEPYQLDFQDYSIGIWLLKIRKDQTQVTFKLIKQ